MELTNSQREDIEAIRNLPDEAIDTSDATEVLDWSRAKRGVLYRPVKREVALNLDEYVIEWFESNYCDAGKRDEAINAVLMEHIRGCEFPAHKGKKEATA